MTDKKQETGLTFFSRKGTTCPVCRTVVYREEMRSGRGRLIAGRTTDELRRRYERSQRYGQPMPLLYPITVCPACHYAAFSSDFTTAPKMAKTILRVQQAKQLQAIATVLPTLEFTRPRTLSEGIASYWLALCSYEFFPPTDAPTFKKSLCSLRAAWLASDLHIQQSEENYDMLAGLFYRKARFLYSLALEREENGQESVPTRYALGPDTDHNWGFDGFLYICALLDVRYGPRSDATIRKRNLGNDKRILSRIFDMGKASKAKPAEILERSRRVYDEIRGEVGS